MNIWTAIHDLVLNFQTHFRWEDTLDVVIVAFMIYRLLLLIRGTRAVQMLFGVAFLSLGYFVSNIFGLYATHWVLSHFFDYLVIIVIVIFQDDIRRALARVGRNPFWLKADDDQAESIAEEVARSATQLARDKKGALIVIERETGLKNFIDTGSLLDCRVRSEIISSIFLDRSPLHDGAVIIHRGRIAAAGCFLPLSKSQDIPAHYGTRHRAALGVTEDTDALVILVSETTAAVHLVYGGKIEFNLNERDLIAGILRLMAQGDQHG